MEYGSLSSDVIECVWHCARFAVVKVGNTCLSAQYAHDMCMYEMFVMQHVYGMCRGCRSEAWQLIERRD